MLMIDGREYFPATQCAKLLGYADPFKAVKQHCKSDGWVKRPVIDRLGRTQEMNFINEGNLYRLIVSSKLSAAEKFERWVFDEVLPGIRQTGSYGAVDIEKIIAQTATAVATEIMRQVIPVLAETAQKISTDEYETLWEVKSPKKRKPTGIIYKLAPEIRTAVDNMLRSGASYVSVKKYLAGIGVGISEAAICRYYNTYLNE